MFIKTVSTKSGINPIKFDETGGVFYWILNTGSSTVYASTEESFSAGDDGVVSLGPKESRRLETKNDTIYILGEGQVEVHNQRDGICSFKQAPTSSGGGGTVDAYTKTESDARYAQKSDIPTTLPANGGNADTIDEKHATDFVNAYNDLLMNYLSGQKGDIRGLAYKLPMGNFAFSVGDAGLGDITFPLNHGSLTWIPSKYNAKDLIYGLLIIRPLVVSTGSTFICTVYNTTKYTDWQEIPIAQVDLSPYMKISTEIPVQDAASSVGVVTQSGVMVTRDYVAKPTNASSCTRYYRTFSPDASKYADMRVTVSGSTSAIQFEGTANISSFTINGKQVITEDNKFYVTGTFSISSDQKTTITLGFTPSIVIAQGRDTGYRVNVKTIPITNGFTAEGFELSGSVPVTYIAFK